jgi:hypothetical protein
MAWGGGAAMSGHTVVIGKGLWVLMWAAIVVVAAAVGLYFYSYGLPPPLGQREVEIREVIKEVKVPEKTAGTAAKHDAIDSFESEMRFVSLLNIPYEIVFDAEITGMEVYELEGEKRCDVHIKLTNGDDKYWTDRELEIVVRKQPIKGVSDIEERLKWGKIYLEPWGSTVNIFRDDDMAIKAIHVDSPGEIIPYKYVGKDEIKKELGS